MFTTLLIFLLLLTLLVFVHELGHFVAAKRSGAKVLEFGFGFPPRMFGFTRGETVYSINWIPLGGFVRIKGEAGESKDADSFTEQPAWKRFLILISGVGMNLVLAAVLLSVLFSIGAPTSLDQQLPAGAIIRDRKIQILSVLPNTPADQAGLKFGDVVLSLNGQAITSVKQVQDFNAQHAGQAETVVYARGTEQHTTTLTPTVGKDGGPAVWGVGLSESGLVRLPWYKGMYYGLRSTFMLTWQILASLGLVLADLIMHQKVAAEISGPVGIAAMTGQVAHLGFQYLLQFAALLSINLAVINFLPIPSLDGGRVLFLFIETLRKKPINPRVEALVHNVGFTALLVLIALVTFRDISHYSGKIGAFISGIFGGF